MAIDRAVLWPGQELMERMDRECHAMGDWKARAEVEEEMRRGKIGMQGQDVEREKEMKEKWIKVLILLVTPIRRLLDKETRLLGPQTSPPSDLQCFVRILTLSYSNHL